MNMQQAMPTTAAIVSNPTLDAMLADLPTAHPAPPIGRRVAGQGCHGERVAARTAGIRQQARLPRIRFVYFPAAVDEHERQTAYHQHLVTAEVLLGRVLAAQAAGIRCIVPSLDYAAEARVTVRPPRHVFHAATLEYRRWYDDGGAARPQPLTQQALAARLATADRLSLDEARHRAIHRSHALPAADQAWLIERRHTPLEHRPLNQAEFQTLVDAIDGAYRAPAGALRVEQANRQIALHVAAMLGSLLDEYVASPFTIDALSEAYGCSHLAHLRQIIASSRQVETDSGVLLGGSKAWFAAKTARMHAEHQIGLAMSPSVYAMRLTGRPVVAVVGGKLHTFVNGWHRGGSRSATIAAQASAVG